MINQMNENISFDFVVSFSLAHGMSHRTSWVWDHFKDKNPGGKVICQVDDAEGKRCGAELNFNLTSMAYHLTHVHGLQKGSPSKRQKLMPTSKIMTRKAILLSEKEQMCLAWAANGLAYDVLDEPNFKAAFKCSIPSGFGRKELSSEMILFAEKMREILSKKIHGQPVTLALDGGTIHKKLQSLCLIVGGQSFYLKSVPVC